MSHTPGPWRYETDEASLNAVVYGKGRIPGQHKQFVAQVWSGTDRTLEVAIENAKLIAAAPDLLAALQHVIDINALVPNSEADIQVRAAIAKAIE